jgi:dihydroxy-acid dehydratase
MVREDIKPTDIMTREAFENAIVVNSAIGGSTNAPIHLNGIARHVGVELDNDDWQEIGHDVPLLVNLQPAGEYLGEDYFHAGGVPAVVAELMRHGRLPHPGAMTVNGKPIGENCEGITTDLPDVIKPFDRPLKEKAGFINLKGNLFDSAIMKTSVISEEFRARYLSNPTIRRLSRAGRSSSRDPRTTTTGSTIRSSRSTSTACCSSAAPARSGIRAAPKW